MNTEDRNRIVEDGDGREALEEATSQIEDGTVGVEDGAGEDPGIMDTGRPPT